MDVVEAYCVQAKGIWGTIPLGKRVMENMGPVEEQVGHYFTANIELVRLDVLA